MSEIYDCIIIGGGASGMMASIFSAKNGYNTLVLEHNEKLGKKLYITGKGRCNLTNNSSIENHLQNIVTNGKFMYSALYNFPPNKVMEFFSDAGLKLKTERGNRVFPASDKSSDVINTLIDQMYNYSVKYKLNTEVKRVEKIGKIFYIYCNNDMIYTTYRLIVSTGGMSYSGTGASKIGYDIARSFGHYIIRPKSALCPIILKEHTVALNGVSLKNVRLTIILNNGKEFSEFGELLFTYTSLSGPIALALSSKINKYSLNNAIARIDFKPALTYEDLDAKFQREFKTFAKKYLRTYIKTLLPNKFCEYFFVRTGLKNVKLADLTKENRLHIINLLKKFDFSIKSLDNINVGIVTSGGVDIKEINSKTCESKLVENLYFTGEVLDVDALTGGYNLQIAWSTAYLAGNNLKG